MPAFDDLVCSAIILRYYALYTLLLPILSGLSVRGLWLFRPRIHSEEKEAGLLSMRKGWMAPGPSQQHEDQREKRKGKRGEDPMAVTFPSVKVFRRVRALTLSSHEYNVWARVLDRNEAPKEPATLLISPPSILQEVVSAFLKLNH